MRIYDREIAPILEIHCFGCHGDGAEEGGLTLDQFSSDREMLTAQEMWWSVIKNVRSEVMPPEGEERLSHEEREQLFAWINANVFRSDSTQLDPGRVTLRRLNRREYRNTIADLMGIDFDTDVEFPPDDSGNGFDNNADALSISPLLAEKYLQAARDIVDQAVPKQAKRMGSHTVPEDRFRGDDGSDTSLSFRDAADVSASFELPVSGTYRLVFPFLIRGSFDFDPARAHVQVFLDEMQVHADDHGWQPKEEKRCVYEGRLEAGEHRIRVTVTPLEPEPGATDPDTERVDDEEDPTFVRLVVQPIHLEGPLEPSLWPQPENYSRFFHRDEAPSEPEEKSAYAREVIRRFCRRAYRRPVSAPHLDGLVSLAGLDEAAVRRRLRDGTDNRTFEQRCATAFTAALASPRFLFRVEQPVKVSKEAFPLIDEHALATRLSYLFWSTMPDEELSRLADQGELRDQLDAQIDRLLEYGRAEAMIRNFVGQWLQTRDVLTVSIDPLAAMGVRDEYEELRDYLRSLPDGRRKPPKDAPPEHRRAYERISELRDLRRSFDGDLRRAMGDETETLFTYLVREDRSLLELLSADYAFLNEALAEHYRIDGIELEGDRLRKVKLPPGSPFGGILTQGAFLAVTSNPTRTSPVKRGLFILDNILGTPAPPAPGDVPELEEAEQESVAENATLRELLEIHRSEALCRSCHARFDPLGLAFENFTAVGTWRDEQNGKPIDASGQLITGESFDDVRELKEILVGSRRRDFYRCIAERFLSYAIGRDLDFRDEMTLDKIVQSLEETDGRASSLIKSVVNSAPFQRTRREQTLASAEAK